MRTEFTVGINDHGIYRHTVHGQPQRRRTEDWSPGRRLSAVSVPGIALFVKIDCLSLFVAEYPVGGALACSLSAYLLSHPSSFGCDMPLLLDTLRCLMPAVLCETAVSLSRAMTFFCEDPPKVASFYSICLHRELCGYA